MRVCGYDERTPAEDTVSTDGHTWSGSESFMFDDVARMCGAVFAHISACPDSDKKFHSRSGSRGIFYEIRLIASVTLQFSAGRRVKNLGMNIIRFLTVRACSIRLAGEVAEPTSAKAVFASDTPHRI